MKSYSFAAASSLVIFLSMAQSQSSFADPLMLPVDLQPKRELPCATHQLTINAPMSQVWNAIKAHRSSDLQHRRPVGQDGNVTVIEETYMSLPIIGTIKCTYAEKETIPGQHMDYYMVDSTRFRAFEGHWNLEPTPDGKGTIVELTAVIDPGVRVPFWKDIAHAAVSKNVKETLEEVEELTRR